MTIEQKIDAFSELLFRDGFCIIPDAVPAAKVEALSRDLDPAFAATHPPAFEYQLVETPRRGVFTVRR